MGRRIKRKTKKQQQSDAYWRKYRARRQREWNSRWYKNLRKLVFARDGWTCALTGKKGGVLHMHHIKRYADFPALRFDPRNLITLCAEAHEKVTGQEAKYMAQLWKIAQQRERARKRGKAGNSDSK